jgi:hypothetical protein
MSSDSPYRCANTAGLLEFLGQAPETGRPREILHLWVIAGKGSVDRTGQRAGLHGTDTHHADDVGARHLGPHPDPPVWNSPKTGQMVCYQIRTFHPLRTGALCAD